MKITKEVDYRFLVKASFDDVGKLKVTLSCTVPYGNRTSTTTVDITDEKVLEAVSEVLQTIIDKESPRVMGYAEAGAAQSHIVAANLGEKI